MAPPYSALDQIRRTPGLKLAHRTELNTLFFGLDQGSAELRSSNIKGHNPFKDERVRQAMAYAIDIEPILARFDGRAAGPGRDDGRPGRQRLFGGTGPASASRPRKARALLAEAGYPDGFRVTLDCPSEYGDDEIATCRGVAEQLGAVGIEVDINLLPQNAFDTKLYKDRQSDFFFEAGTWIRIPRRC